MSSECGNPTCSNAGKMKCSACTTVMYCSPTCQKQHWPEHKGSCKASKVTTGTDPASPSKTIQQSTPDMNFQAIHAQLQSIKTTTQQSFQKGDFTTVIKESATAVDLARKLPAPAGPVECFQIELNVGSAFMQMRDVPGAIQHTEEAIKYAHIAAQHRPGQPQSIELLAMGLNNRAFQLLQLPPSSHPNALEEAIKSADSALEKAEAIFPKNDPRLCKYIKAVAACRDRQDQHSEAEKLLFKAYTIVSLKTGAHTADAQSIIDDLVNMLVRRGDITNAEKYSRNNVKSVSEKQLDDQGALCLSDALSRLAMVLKRSKKFEEAESILMQALNIREQKLPRKNHLGVAHTLVQLASVQDMMGKLDDDAEVNLMRALDMFNSTKGPNSPEAQDILRILRDVKVRRKALLASAAGGTSGATAGTNKTTATFTRGRVKPVVMVEDDDDDELQCTVTEESRMSIPSKNSTASSSSSRGTTSVVTRAGSTNVVDELSKLELDPTDGVGRMMHANSYFEQSMFSHAEVLISEAHAIFLKTNGPDHPTTRTARQNLMVARNNSLNQLWMHVAAEMVSEVAASDGNKGLEENSSVEAKNAQESTVNSSLSAEEQSQVNEYAKMMSSPKKRSSEEQLLFADSTSSGERTCLIS